MITLCDAKRHNPDYYTEIVLCVDGVEWKKRSERERERARKSALDFLSAYLGGGAMPGITKIKCWGKKWPDRYLLP